MGNKPMPRWRPFEEKDLQPWYIGSQGKILNCYSKGDRRFSALYARLRCGQTVENLYQGAKLDANKQPLPIVAGAEKDTRKGKDFQYIQIAGKAWDYAYKHEFYYMLWYTYLLEHEDLLAYACEFDGYTDFYDGYAGMIYPQTLDIDPGPVEMRCCQARAIQWMVASRPLCADLVPIFEQYTARYWK